MRPQSEPKILTTLFRAGVALLLSQFAHAGPGYFYTDFNSGQPPGTHLYGNAFIDSAGGLNDSGVLKLTVADYDQVGSLIIDDLTGGEAVTGFTASFKLYLGGGTGADGFSFNFANDIWDGPIWEEGAGSGLRFVFDTFNNGADLAPAIDIKSADRLLYSFPLWFTGDYMDVFINLDPDGTFDFAVNGIPWLSGARLFYTPTVGRFALGARTGAATDNHWVDDLKIAARTDLPNHPVVRWALPFQSVPALSATLSILVQDGLASLDPASVHLTLDGRTVVPTLSKSGDLTTIEYDVPQIPNPFWMHQVVVTFADTGSPPFQQQFSYQFSAGRNLGPGGHLYEVVFAPGTSWDDAKAAAAQRTWCGTSGHLATLTTPWEDGFVRGLHWQFLREAGYGDDQFWIGGFQSPDAPAPGDGWSWINGEGAIPGLNGFYPPFGAYANWGPGEPNDYDGPGSEQFLALRTSGWNDASNPESVLGYIVEYPSLTVDVRPDDPDNAISLQSRGQLPVAVLLTPCSPLDVSSIRFGRSGWEALPVAMHEIDLDQDGTPDLLLRFRVEDLGLQCGDQTAVLTARTTDGRLLMETTPIRTNCKGPSRGK